MIYAALFILLLAVASFAVEDKLPGARILKDDFLSRGQSTIPGICMNGDLEILRI